MDPRIELPEYGDGETFKLASSIGPPVAAAVSRQ